MENSLEKIFEKQHIEYFASLDYSVVGEINTGLRERMSFSPRSVIAFLVPYYTGEVLNFSRYAASLDYHLVIKKITDALITDLKVIYPDASFRGFGDHSPINERKAALLGGLGFIGDNGLIINEKYGSYVFVADILTDIPSEALLANAPSATRECMHCGRCKAACPTGVLKGESESCLSAITQRKGELSEWEISLMRSVGTAWGCDICQSSCPYNEKPALTPLKIFYDDRIERLSTELITSMSDEEFSKRAFAWRGRKTLLRNLKLLDM